MSEKYLNGKISITSLAAPTPEGVVKLRTLSKGERNVLLSKARKVRLISFFQTLYSDHGVAITIN